MNLSKDKYCSVSAMLAKTAKITYTSSMLSEIRRSSATGLPLYCCRCFVLGDRGHSWSRRYRTASRHHAVSDRSSDPVAKPDDALSTCSAADIADSPRPSGLKVPGGDLVRFLLIGVLGVAASNYLYYLAIERTNVATAIILQYTAPVWVLLYTVMRGAQRPSMRRSAAVGLAVVGCALAVGFVGSGALKLDIVGVCAALLAAFSFAFYNVGGHSVLARYDRWKVLLWVLASAATFWMFINPPWKIVSAHYTLRQWGFMLIFSLLSVLGPFSCYFAGLQYLEPTRAVVVSCLEPVFSIVIAAIALGELLRPLQTLGIVVVLVAIVLIQWPDTTGREELILEPIE